MMNSVSRVGMVALSIVLSIPVFSGSAQAFDGPASKNSWGCDDSSKRVNFSYHPGDVTTTVYYNNHCDYTVQAAADIKDHNGSLTHDCFSIPAGKKSHIKFQQGASGTFINIDKC
ncbi:hypothetical protein ACH4S8_13510 [Streptomyces sp. NPDC021080]|uniref:hypothetical protein n=1 Tax=Streptomyces sp. NPDC021080 TaxID=3365110 RepID=UPI0037A18BF2